MRSQKNQKREESRVNKRRRQLAKRSLAVWRGCGVKYYIYDMHKK